MILERAPSILLILAVSIVSAGAIIGALIRLLRPATPIPYRADEPVQGAAVFLFQGGVLSDATSAAQDILATARIGQPDLSSITAHLSRQFPDLPDRIAAIRQNRDQATTGRVVQTLTAPGGTATLQIDAAHGLIRLTIAEPDAGQGSGQANRTGATNPQTAQLAAMEDELQTLRSIAEDAPQLIWKQNPAGHVVWANSAYLRLSDKMSPPGADSDPLWPATPLLSDLKPVEKDGAPVVQRIPVLLPGQTEPQWYEVTSVRRGAMSVHFAVDASSTMQAENGRQKFIQTLTKTFAHLSIGLAIFDRDRRLVLFNPAFLDLTSLPVGFLSARPLVNSVLDRLRDMNMLPEPKNYISWRDQVAALEAAAVRGTYCETWSLPSGQTYRVTGRPHPDGAIAFLFEDISDEILLTRHFRSELETAQSVLDSLDEGIAVFSQAGTLMLSNALYSEMWGPGAEGLQHAGLTDEMARWQRRSAPSPVWDRLRHGTDAVFDRTRWQEVVRLDDGRALVCRFAPLTGGSTLIGFRPALSEPARLIPTPEDMDTAFRRSRPLVREATGT